MNRKFRKATVAERLAMEHAFLSAVLRYGRAGVDEAHALFELPQDVEPRTWGAICNGLQAKGLIQRTGEMHTKRAIAHGRRIGLYVVSDRKLAVACRDRLAASAARQRERQLILPGIDAGDELSPT